MRACLDEVWYLHTDPEERLPRLVERHVESGKSQSEAEEWVERSDEANARLVAATRHRSDRVVDVVSLAREEGAAPGRTGPASD